MRIIRLSKNIYKAYDYTIRNNVLHPFREKYEQVLSNWKESREKYKMSFKDLAKHYGFSRATYYRKRKILNELNSGRVPIIRTSRVVRLRRWGDTEINLVLRIRRENPSYGKSKITTILKRDHDFKMSESTVGRIINYLKDKGIIQRSISAHRTKRKRNFNRQANPLKFKRYEEMVMGEGVQIDHMTVMKNGIRFKHFQAWERKSKTLVAQIYSRARSSDAKKFLQHLLKTAPYKVLSIQVDGGSEFMGDFEEACAELKIPLEVLPPATPKYNGGVERANKTLREEFYANPNLLADSLGEMRFELQKAIRKYNEYRPHAALHGLTHSEYISSYSESTSLSHLI